MMKYLRYGKRMDDLVVAGSGGYGIVLVRNGVAVKQFERLKHLIQEYAACNYLRNDPLSVHTLGADFDELEMSMNLYDCSFSKWMKEKKTEGQKLGALREILRAMTYIQDLGLIHGDIKPGNILIKQNSMGDITELVLGDQGFLAPKSGSYTARVRRTTQTYREEELKSDYKHDMYSLGITIIELFRDIRFHKERSYRDLYNNAKKIKNDNIRNCTLRLISRDRSERPAARKVLKDLFGESPPYQEYQEVNDAPNRLSSDDTRRLKKIFDKWGKPRGDSNGILRSNYAYRATVNYINRNNVHRDNHKLYAYSMLVIFSSIFGGTSFGIKSTAKRSKKDINTVKRTVMKLVTDDETLRIIFHP